MAVHVTDPAGRTTAGRVGRVGAGRGPRAAARAALGTRLAVAALVVAAIATGGTGGSWSAVETPLVVVGLLLALPHGAADAAAPWLRRRRLAPARLAGLAGAYLALAALTWWVCSTWPAVGLTVLLGASVAHFGSGESTFHRLRDDDPPRGYALVTGLVVVALPLLARPRDTAGYLSVMVPGWDGRVPTTGALVLAVGIVLAAGATVATCLRRGDRGPGTDLVLLLAAALSAPPVVSIGVYVALWHSTRHVAVVMDDAAGVAPTGRARLLRWAALPAAVALGAALVLGLLSTGAPLVDFLRGQIWMLTALAVPHALVVRWLDATRSELDPAPRPTTTPKGLNGAGATH